MYSSLMKRTNKSSFSFKEKLLNKLLKVWEILKRLINRSKSDIDHRINLLEGEQDIISDFLAWNLCSLRLPRNFQIIDQRINQLWTKRSLCKGKQDGFSQFCSIIKFFRSISFNYHQLRQANSLKGRKSMSTSLAFSPPSNNRPLFNHPWVHDFRIHILTFWAFHARIVKQN